MLVDSEVEIRQVFTTEDFGDAMTPELREQEERLRQGERRLTQSASNPTLEPDRFDDGKAMWIVGLKRRYTLSTRSKIADHWHEFVPQLDKISGKVGPSTYGVAFNSDADCNFDYLSGVETAAGQELPKGMDEIHVPAQRYAVFKHRGHVTTFADTIDAVWTKWLPASGRKSASGPCIERYDENFNPQTGMGGMEFWLPVQA
jgi:AraC family transcriptional regulator